MRSHSRKRVSCSFCLGTIKSLFKIFCQANWPINNLSNHVSLKQLAAITFIYFVMHKCLCNILEAKLRMSPSPKAVPPRSPLLFTHSRPVPIFASLSSHSFSFVNIPVNDAGSSRSNSAKTFLLALQYSNT